MFVCVWNFEMYLEAYGMHTQMYACMLVFLYKYEIESMFVCVFNI